MWQQTGIPCVEALQVLKNLDYTSKPSFHQDYFHKVHLTNTLKDMFGVDNYRPGLLPSDSSVKDRKLIQRFDNLKPKIKELDNLPRTTKRIASTGEASNQGNITISRLLSRQKKPCQHCGKLIIGLHKNASACNKYREKTGFKYNNSGLTSLSDSNGFGDNDVIPTLSEELLHSQVCIISQDTYFINDNNGDCNSHYDVHNLQQAEVTDSRGWNDTEVPHSEEFISSDQDFEEYCDENSSLGSSDDQEESDISVGSDHDKRHMDTDVIQSNIVDNNRRHTSSTTANGGNNVHSSTNTLNVPLADDTPKRTGGYDSDNDEAEMAPIERSISKDVACIDSLAENSLCCAGAACSDPHVDVSNSHHYCSVSSRRVHAWCYPPDIELGFGSRAPCSRCSELVTPIAASSTRKRKNGTPAESMKEASDQDSLKTDEIHRIFFSDKDKKKPKGKNYKKPKGKKNKKNNENILRSLNNLYST